MFLLQSTFVNQRSSFIFSFSTLLRYNALKGTKEINFVLENRPKDYFPSAGLINVHIKRSRTQCYLKAVSISGRRVKYFHIHNSSIVHLFVRLAGSPLPKTDVLCPFIYTECGVILKLTWLSK